MMNKNEFNRVAEDLGGGDGGRAERAKRSSARVIFYADIDKVLGEGTEEAMTLRDKMENVMSAIDREPTNFDSIIAYGVPPIEALGNVAKSIMKVQASFDEQVKVMYIAQDKMDKGIAEMGLDKLISGVKTLGKGVGNVAAAGVSGLAGLTKKVWEGLSGSGKKRTEEEAHIYAMIDSLPQMHMDMQKLTLGMREAEVGVKSVMKEAEKLGVARVETTRDLNIYLGAAPEVLRRYDEVYIKEAREAYADSGDPEDEMYLNNVINARDHFADQERLLNSSRAQGIEAAQRLRMLLEQMEKQRKIIQQSRTIRENEFVALLSGAGFAGSSLKLAQMIKKFDDAGDNMQRITMEMQEKAHEMSLASQGRGTVSPELLIESLSRMQKMIEKEGDVRAERNRELEASRQQVYAATEKLLDSVDKAKKARMLEALSENEDKKEPKTIVANDNNAEAKPEAAATENKQRKTGNKPPKP